MEPLASRIRPKSLAEFVGQEHLTAPNKTLRTAIEKKELFSFILWGPPGTGKTTLARIYSKEVGADFYELSAVEAGKDDIRKIIVKGQLFGPDSAKATAGRAKVLFIDEIHRFNKAQQDFLLPFVERGDITLVGATTENPSFEVIGPLLSRCRVFILHELTNENMIEILARTKIKMPKAARDWLIDMSAGDARSAITVLDTAQRL